MSAISKLHLAMIHTLPCVVHLYCYGKSRNADEAHHLEFDRGVHSDFATIPVCEECHTELHHLRRRPFYLAHKLTDVKLLAWTIELIAGTRNSYGRLGSPRRRENAGSTPAGSRHDA